MRAPARDLIAIGTLAFVPRAAWALVFGRVDVPPHDAGFFETAADHLANGHGYTQTIGEATAHAPPGFPFLVSLLYRVFGLHLKLGLALNVVLGTLAALGLYLVASRVLGRGGGLVAGGLMAILPAPIFFTGLFLPETTFAFMLVGFLALAVFLPRRSWTPVALGLAAGLVALTKGEGLLLAVIPLAMWWGERDWLRRSALLLVAMGLTILPWTVRNAVEMDSFIPVATNASSTIWVGHNAAANGSFVSAPPELLARVPAGLGASRHEVAETGLLRREAAHWAIRNPPKELGLVPRKLIALGDAASNSFHVWFNDSAKRELGGPSIVVFSVLDDAGDYLLILLALAAVALLGGRRLWRLDPVMRGALAYLVASLITYGVLYYGEFRYRLAMEPMLILVATPLVVLLWQQRSILRRPE